MISHVELRRKADPAMRDVRVSRSATPGLVIIEIAVPYGPSFRWILKDESARIFADMLRVATNDERAGVQG